MGKKRKDCRSTEEEGPWVTVRSWSKTFDRDVEVYSVLQSRSQPLRFMATRSFVVGGFEQDYKKEHLAVDGTEANGILRNPESFHRRMDL